MVISGLRCFGSSFGSSKYFISDVESVNSIIFFASWPTVISFGLPILKTSYSDEFINEIIPATVSSTYEKLRVCDPSPYIVIFSFFSACTIKFVTTLPSFNCILGP